MTTEILLLVVLLLLFVFWVYVSRIADLLEALLNAQTKTLQVTLRVAQHDREQKERTLKHIGRRREAERRINKCPLCEGAKIFRGAPCVYCLGYGEARRSDEAEARFRDWAAEVRKRWTEHFGLPY